MSQDEHDKLWRELRDADAAYLEARMRLLANVPDLVAVIGAALSKPSERGAALRVLQIVPELQARAHLPQLARLAAVGHSDIAMVRSVIETIERSWLVQHIEAEIEPILETGGSEEFRRIAELYKALDENLLKAHLVRCETHADEQVQEVAADFRERTNGES